MNLASLNKVADETAETGKKLARSLIRGKKVPPKGQANIPVDYASLESSTTLLGLIYRLLVRNRQEQILQKEEEQSHAEKESLEKDRQLEQLIKALTIQKPKRKSFITPSFKVGRPKTQGAATSPVTNVIGTAGAAITTGKIILGTGVIAGSLAISQAIAKGESAKGSYNAANMGTRNDKIVPIKTPVNLQELTVKEVMQRQSIKWGSPNEDKKLFAVGKYQIIPGTLKDAVKTLNIDTSQKFDADLQEKIFKEYLITKKNPDIAKYLNSPVDDPNLLYAAIKSLSNEWASIADPDKPGGKTSHYGSGNKASISVDEMATLLRSDRENIQKQKSTEVQPTAKIGDQIDSSSKLNTDMKSVAKVKQSASVNNVNVNKTSLDEDTAVTEELDDRSPYSKKK